MVRTKYMRRINGAFREIKYYPIDRSGKKYSKLVGGQSEDIFLVDYGGETHLAKRAKEQDYLLERRALEILSGLEGIVRLIEADDPQKILVLEYCGGGDLSSTKRIVTDSEREYPHNGIEKLGETRVAYILNRVSEALNEIHKLDLVHGDIKPENIFLTDEGLLNLRDNKKISRRQIKLGDLGLCRKLEGDVNELKGTYEYLPRENFRRGTYNRKSDIFSLGVTAFELLTGKLPKGFEIRENLEEYIVRRGKLTTERLLGKGTLIRLVNKMLSKYEFFRPSAYSVYLETQRILEREELNS